MKLKNLLPLLKNNRVIVYTNKDDSPITLFFGSADEYCISDYTIVEIYGTGEFVVIEVK